MKTVIFVLLRILEINNRPSNGGIPSAAVPVSSHPECTGTGECEHEWVKPPSDMFSVSQSLFSLCEKALITSGIECTIYIYIITHIQKVSFSFPFASLHQNQKHHSLNLVSLSYYQNVWRTYMTEHDAVMFVFKWQWVKWIDLCTIFNTRFKFLALGEVSSV